eukprot:3020063-Amphidinium_carterae.1
MAFERDLGHACICLPLKLAVAIITMYICTISLVCLLAVLTGNVMRPCSALDCTHREENTAYQYRHQQFCKK